MISPPHPRDLIFWDPYFYTSSTLYFTIPKHFEFFRDTVIRIIFENGKNYLFIESIQFFNHIDSYYLSHNIVFLLWAPTEQPSWSFSLLRQLSKIVISSQLSTDSAHLTCLWTFNEQLAFKCIYGIRVNTYSCCCITYSYVMISSLYNGLTVQICQ